MDPVITKHGEHIPIMSDCWWFFFFLLETREFMVIFGDIARECPSHVRISILPQSWMRPKKKNEIDSTYLVNWLFFSVRSGYYSYYSSGAFCAGTRASAFFTVCALKSAAFRWFGLICVSRCVYNFTRDHIVQRGFAGDIIIVSSVNRRWLWQLYYALIAT